MAEVDAGWNRMGQAQRFGVLRSALAQGPTDEGLARVCRMLHAMERQAPERFEEEVYPYARRALAGWGEHVWRDEDRLLRALGQGMCWPGVLGWVRAEVRLKMERLLRDAPMEGIRRLELGRYFYSEHQVDAIFDAPWVAQLESLSVCGLQVGGLARALPRMRRLESLELGASCTSTTQVAALGALEGLRRVVLPYESRMYGMARHWVGLGEPVMEEALERLLATARWRALEALGGRLWTERMTRLVAERGWPVRELWLGDRALAHGLGLLEVCDGVEVLSLELDDAQGLEALLEAAPRLRVLRISARLAREEACAALSRSPRAARLERIELDPGMWYLRGEVKCGDAAVGAWPRIGHFRSRWWWVL